MKSLFRVASVLFVVALAVSVVGIASANNTWAVGNLVGLCAGTHIYQGPGGGYPYHTIVPEDNWTVKVIDGPRYFDGEPWWDTSRFAAGDPSGGTGWVKQSEADSCFGGGGGGGGGGGTATPPPYVPQLNTRQAPCDYEGKVKIGQVTDFRSTHHYVEYKIPDSTGTQKVVRLNPQDINSMAQPFSNNGWISAIIRGESTKTISIGPIFGRGPFTKSIDIYGGPILVNGPGAKEGHRFDGDPNPPITVPPDTWHIFIPTRLLFGISIELWPGMFWTITPVGNEYYGENPETVAYLQCNYTEVTTPQKKYYALLESVGIAGSEVGKQYSYSFNFPSWMSSATVTLRTGSDATIRLHSPDGTIYDAAHPNVEYTHSSQYSVLKLNQSGGGQWNVLIDVTDAQPDSVFYINISGTYGDGANVDVLAPFTNITVDATHGLNPWLVSDARITLSAEDAGGSGVAKIEWSIDGGTSWNGYSAPVIISQEGLTVFTARATDNAGNVEILPPIKYIRIDKTLPVVNVSVDQAEYTRVEPFVVHFSGYDPMPGSGLALLTTLFNNQPVIDGQVVDLFWLPLGTYTLTVTGEDNAGWVTTNSKTITLIATIPSLQQTVNRLCAENYITKQGMCTSLSKKLASALAAQQRGQNKTAVNILLAFQNELKAQKGKAVTVQAYDLLMMDSNYIIQVLGGK